jgi:glutamyl-tRNA reductase
MQRLLLLGLNHTTAPLGLRERLAFSPEQQRQAIEALRSRFPECEAVLVSTCNRVELYVARAVHGHPRVEEMSAFLSEFHGVPEAQFKEHLYQHSEQEAVQHLFTVTASLDSMVPGESQILGQVRQAYELAHDRNATGSLLNPLFQRAVAAGKEVMHTTSLGEGRVSISGVAVGYARRIFDHFRDKTVLCVGAGKMAILALRGFAALGPKQLVVCNRDAEKAERVAKEFGGTGAALETLQQQLLVADIVITSTGAPHPIITRDHFEHLIKQRRYRPIFLIDIALPRDVEPSVGELDRVFLYNLDDLQKAVLETHTQRGGAVDAARAIVQKHVGEFLAWQQQRELGPAIDKLYKRFHDMAAEEVGRTLHKLPNLHDTERAQLEDLARRIVNKLLHDPVKTMREGDLLKSPTGQYASAIERIFRLSEDDQNGEKPGTQSTNGDAESH